MNSKACFDPLYTCILYLRISPQRGSALNTHSNDFIRTYSERVTSHKWKNCQFDEGPLGPKLSWDYTSEMSKCDTGRYSFLHYITAIL